MSLSHTATGLKQGKLDRKKESIADRILRENGLELAAVRQQIQGEEKE